MFSRNALHCNAFKAHCGAKNYKYDIYFQERVSKGGEVFSFWRLGWAMLNDMNLNKMEKKFSNAIPALDNLLAVTI